MTTTDQPTPELTPRDRLHAWAQAMSGLAGQVQRAATELAKLPEADQATCAASRAASSLQVAVAYLEAAQDEDLGPECAICRRPFDFDPQPGGLALCPICRGGVDDAMAQAWRDALPSLYRGRP